MFHKMKKKHINVTSGDEDLLLRLFITKYYLFVRLLGN